MKLFKSKRVKELEEKISYLYQIISNKDDYICHLKTEIEFLQGKNQIMLEEARKNVVTYKALRYVSKYDFDIPKDLIKRDLTETLVRAIMPHLKIEKREQKELGIVYETSMQIVEGENE